MFRDKIAKSMLRKLVIGATSAAVLTCSSFACAQQRQFRTANEARTLLERAVLLVKADKAAAFAKFLSGADGFKFLDLYAFDGRINVGASDVMGKDARTLLDKEGSRWGERMFTDAREDKTIEIGCMFPRPGSETPVMKVSFVTEVADQICGVGYYP